MRIIDSEDIQKKTSSTAILVYPQAVAYVFVFLFFICYVNIHFKRDKTKKIIQTKMEESPTWVHIEKSFNTLKGIMSFQS